MLNEEEKMPNNEQQSEEVLNQENNQKSEPKFAMWKRGVLLAIGIAGLYGFAFLAVFMVQGLPKSDRSASINLIAYSFLVLQGNILIHLHKQVEFQCNHLIQIFLVLEKSNLVLLSFRKLLVFR